MKALVENARRFILHTSRSGGLVWMTSVIGVQGASLIALGGASQVVPGDVFVRIRLLEGYLSTVGLLCTLGIPSAISCGVKRTSGEDGSSDLASCLGLGAAIALLIALVSPFVWSLLPGKSSELEVRWLIYSAPVVVMIGISRISLAHLHQRLELRQVAKLTVLPSIVMVPLGVGLAFFAGELGWVIARTACEGILAIGLIAQARPALTKPLHLARAMGVLGFGLAAVLSLTLDRIASFVDVMLLRYRGADIGLVASYSMFSIVLQVAALPCGALCASGLSKASQASAGGGSVIVGRASLMSACLVLNGLISLIVLAGYWCYERIAQARPHLSGTALLIMVASFFIRSMLMPMGAILYSSNRPWIGAIANSAGLLAMLAGVALAPGLSPELLICVAVLAGLSMRLLILSPGLAWRRTVGVPASSPLDS